MSEIKSILKDVQKKLGYDPDMDEFDPDLIDAINAALNVLTQLGVGPASGFAIKSSEETWDDFFGDDLRMAMCKTYVYDRVRMIFDSASLTSATIQLIQDRLREFEWRLVLAGESPKSIPEGV